MTCVLVVEDEPQLALLMTRLLQDAGYQVRTAATAADGLLQALSAPYDLVILDLMLPDLPGEDVLRALLAARPQANVMVVSSVPEVHRRVQALEAGARDFVAKPFASSELLARVRLRLQGPAHAADGEDAPVALLGPVTLDRGRCELVAGDRRVRLSQREYVLLAHLLQHKGQVCSRQELLAQVWGLTFDPGTNVVDVYVRRLRQKLSPDAIETVRHVGYRLADG